MSKKSELMRKRNQYVSQKQSKTTELNGLESDKERLEQAIKSAKMIKEDFDTEKSTFNNIEIDKNEWSGDTRNKADDKKDSLDEAVKTYSEKYDDAIEKMNEDLTKLETKIEGVQGEITRLTNSIASIDSQIAAS